jgi:phage tail sheath protein FI
VSLVDPVNRVVTLEAGVGTVLDMAPGGADARLRSIEFDLELVSPTEAGRRTERRTQLGMDPRHPNYVGRLSPLTDVEVTLASPPSPSAPPANLPALIAATGLQGAADDNPAAIAANDYVGGLVGLAVLDDVNLLCVPDAAALSTEVGTRTVQQAMIDQCEALMDRFAILDPRSGLDQTGLEAQRQALGTDRGFAALYCPWLTIATPTGLVNVPPSGHLAGVFADTASRLGIHKAPANAAIAGALGVERVVDPNEHGQLNEQAVNVIRPITGRGVIVRGARTLSIRTQWRFVNVRLLAIFLEQSIKRGIDFAIFEPNTIATRQKVVRQIREFLQVQWQNGALNGLTPDDAFRVRADDELNPPSEVALGRLTVEVIVVPAVTVEHLILTFIADPTGVALA